MLIDFPFICDLNLAMNPKVCLLAAGNGTRMGHYSEVINKALLPIHKKAIISHIIEKFPPQTEFVIALGYKREQVIDYLAIAHPDLIFTFVHVANYDGPGSGPGLSAYDCKNALNSAFYLVCCDTLWQEDVSIFPQSQNWMAVATSKKEDSINYCNVDVANGKVIELHDKKAMDSETILSFTGLLFIKDFEIFWKDLEDAQLIKNEKQISGGLLSMIQERKLEAHIITWTDVGTKQKYIHELKKFENFDFSKATEFIYIFGDNVIKFFQNPEIAELRVKKAQINSGVFPTIKQHRNNFYSYNYQAGETLYKHVGSDIFQSLLNWLDHDVWKRKNISPIEMQNKCEIFYREKTLARLALFEERYGDNDKIRSINNEIVPTARVLLQNLNWTELYQGEAFFIHGDLQPDNIIYDIAKKKFTLIDWRQEFAGQIDFGDIYYDLAKLSGGINLNYGQIKMNNFTYSESENSCQFLFPTHQNALEANAQLEKYIFERGYSPAKVRLLVGLIYLNMSPLHHWPFDKMLHAMGRERLYQIERQKSDVKRD